MRAGARRAVPVWGAVLLPGLLVVAGRLPAQDAAPDRAGTALPNIVLVYADDIGWGDLSCQGATAVATPNIDRLAKGGLRFTDAYCTSATCTPSRYSLLTGEYAWRRKGTGVLTGDAGLIIEPGRTTLASVLQRAGHRTAVVGKWHLGLGAGGNDWNGELRPGPLEVGFDECFLMPATGDRVPCVYVAGHRVVGLDPKDPITVSFGERIGDQPSGRERPDLLRVLWDHGHDQSIINGISRIGWMTGGASARWVDEDMADVFVDRAVDFLRRHRQQRFFLYFASHDIHVPRLPHPRFAGSTGMGPRGDAIAQLDWCVGRILDTLAELELERDTLVVFTSDNGPVVNDGYRDEAVARLGDHRPAGPFRGGKYSIFEAGTRVPLLVRWPGRVTPGVSGAVFSQVDLLASLARLCNVPLADADAPDSLNHLDALLGGDPAGREHVVQHAGTLALRVGRHKFIAPGRGAAYHRQVDIELGNDPAPQLYDLVADPGETRNLAQQEPELTAAMAARLQALRAAGRTRPPGRLQVFVLAGQSNMVGHGRLEHLRELAADADQRPRYGHLLRDGGWVARNDVWIQFLDRRGPLTAGHGANAERFGPELQFGHRMGEHFADKVLLVKVAWGGRSLAADFRPPGAGGATGPAYVELVQRVRNVLDHPEQCWPQYGGGGCELAGLVWFQGWNDRINQAFVDEYAANLAHLIRDLRREFGVPDLPVVIGETGQGGPAERHPRALQLMAAQAAVAELPEFRGTVRLAPTRQIWQQQPSFDGGYHWFGNAANFVALGDAFADAMLALLAARGGR